MKPETKIISAAMRELGNTIQCDDGVANAACHQAAERLDLLEAKNKELEIDNAKNLDYIGLAQNQMNELSALLFGHQCASYDQIRGAIHTLNDVRTYTIDGLRNMVESISIAAEKASTDELADHNAYLATRDQTPLEGEEIE